MPKNNNIKNKESLVKIMNKEGIDYICIKDMAKQKKSIEPKDVVKNWLRLKNTIEYLGLWEKLNYPSFKEVEFNPLLSEAGSYSFTMGHIRWVKLTNAVLIDEGINQPERLQKLNYIAIHQMKILKNIENRSLLK
jgi:hypothetical protein